MWRRRKRQRTLEAWRSGRTAATARNETGLPDSMGARQRHRAPAPRVPMFVQAARHTASRWQVTAALALALGAVAFAGYLWRAPAFRIDGAEIVGNHRVPADLIYRASYLEGRWSFAVSRADAERRIEMLDDIREARVRVTWPARAIVEVQETAAVFLWQNAFGTLAVDDTGRAIATPAESDGLRIVRDEAGILAAPGDRLDDRTFLAALAYTVPFEDIAFRRGDGFVAWSEQGWEVRLGTDPAAVERQLRVFDALASELSSIADTVELVDLRFASRPYYRLREGANGS